MEDFLDTLPRFVHNYLNKYPINTLSLLKELVCFAVLMSNDRDIICLLTEQLQQERELEQKNNLGVPELIKAVEITHLDEYSFYQNEEEKKVEKQLLLKQSNNNNTIENHMIIENPNSSKSLWIPWKEDDSPNKSTKNQVITPEMSSYHEISSDHSATNSNSNNNNVLDFFWKRKSQNSKSPILISSSSNTTNSQGSSDSPTLISPISPLSLRPISVTSNRSKGNKRRSSLPPLSPMLQLNKSMSETTTSSMGHFTLQRPGSTFTVQARIEHAMQRQQELERKKILVNIPLETPISKRLKQRVNSGVDWKAIKIQGKIALAKNKNQIE